MRRGVLSPVFGGWSLGVYAELEWNQPLLNLLTLGVTGWSVGLLSTLFILLGLILRCVGHLCGKFLPWFWGGETS